MMTGIPLLKKKLIKQIIFDTIFTVITAIPEDVLE